jgi:hypothetical protein
LQNNEEIDKSSRIATLSAGIEGINNVTRALYSYKLPVSYKDLATSANLHPVYVSQCLSSAKDVGLSESAGERGRYKLTQKGEEYGRFISYGDNEGTKSLLKDILLNNPAWNEIIRFLRVNFNQERSALSLVAYVEGKLGKHWSPSLRIVYAKNYSSVLNYAGLIVLSGDNIVSQVSPNEQEISDSKPLSSNLEVRKSIHDTTVPKVIDVDQDNYAEFSIPDSFKIFIRRDVNAFTFFQSQVKESSLFIPWIKNEISKIEMSILQNQSESKPIEPSKTTVTLVEEERER